MKKILVLLATAVMAVACFNGKTVNISGLADRAVREAGNGQLIFRDQLGNALDPITINNDGTFSATLDADITKCYTVAVKCDGQILYDNIGLFIPEPGDLFLNFSSGKFYIEGGKLNKKYTDAIDTYEKINNEKNERYLSDQYESKDDYNKALYEKESNKALSKDIYKKIFSKNSNNFIGLEIFKLALSEGIIDNVATFDRFYNKCKKYIVNSSDYESRRALLVAEEETCETKPFKDISGQDSAGKPVRLSDIVSKSKYTILYFWDPKNAIGIDVTPYFDIVADTFNDSVTLVGCIPSYNTQEDISRFAISGYQILIDDFNSELSKYGLSKAPFSFIINTEGEIIKRNLTGTALVEYMVEKIKK